MTDVKPQYAVYYKDGVRECADTSADMRVNAASGESTAIGNGTNNILSSNVLTSDYQLR